MRCGISIKIVFARSRDNKSDVTCLLLFVVFQSKCDSFAHAALLQPSEASETKIQLPGLEEELDEPPVKKLRERIKVDVDK